MRISKIINDTMDDVIEFKKLSLDRCHRLTELEPGIIVLDILKISKARFKYCLDLYNKAFCRIIRDA